MAKKRHDEPEAGVTEPAAEETVRQLVVEHVPPAPVEPTDEQIVEAMVSAVCGENPSHWRRIGVQQRAEELLAMLRAFQELYRGR
jgi:hypothetical protein